MSRPKWERSSKFGALGGHHARASGFDIRRVDHRFRLCASSNDTLISGVVLVRAQPHQSLNFFQATLGGTGADMDVANSPIVVVVDDDEAVRDSLEILLESHGFRVQTYASAGRFLAAKLPPKIGCLLVDLHMPGMSGLELLRTLRQGRSLTPIIAITGRVDPDLKQQVIQAGVFALLEKPMSDDVLVETIRKAMTAKSVSG